MSRPSVLEVVPGLVKYRWGNATAFTIDGENTSPFQQAMREHVLAESGDIAIHVRSLRMMSSGFVGLLVFLYREIEKGGRRRFLLLNPSLRLRDLLIVMNLAEEINVVTAVEDLPASHLGIECSSDGEISPGIQSYRAAGHRILSIAGPEPLVVANRLGAVADSETGRLALHVGEFDAPGPSFVSVVHEIARNRAARGLELPLLNPSIAFHTEIRKAGLEERFTILTGLDRLVRPGG